MNRPQAPTGGRLVALLLSLMPLLGWAPTARGWPAAPPPLTAAQKQRVQERDRLAQLSRLLEGQGKRTEAIAAARAALAIDREVFGGHSAPVATSLERLARLHEAVADYGSARRTWQELTAVRRQLLGGGDWRATNARLAAENAAILGQLTPAQREELGRVSGLHNQAVDLVRKGKAAAAVPLARQAVELRRRLLGRKHPDVAHALFLLGWAHHVAKQHAQAEALFREAAQLREDVQGELHPDHAFTLDWLAYHHLATGKPAQAVPLYRRTLDIRRRLFGKGEPEYLRICGQLAHAHRQAGEPATAEEVLRETVATCRTIRSANRPAAYPLVLTALAELRRERKDLAEAETLYQEAAAHLRGRLGLRAPAYTAALEGLLATQKERRARQRDELGQKHPEYLALVARQARVSFDAARQHSFGDPAGERRLYQEVLRLCPAGLSRDHWLARDAQVAVDRMALRERLPRAAVEQLDKAAPLDRLVAADFSAGRYASARTNAQASLQLRRAALGPDHPDVALSLNNLGMLHRALGEHDEALRLLGQAWQLRRRALGDDHPQTAISLNNLGLVYFALGEYQQADRCFRRSLAAVEQVVDERHPARLLALNNLAVLYQEVGDHGRAEPLLHRVLAAHLQTRRDDPESHAQRLQDLGGLREALSGSLNWAGSLSATGHYSPLAGYDFTSEIRYRNNLVRSLVLLGNDDEAEKQLRAAVRTFTLASQVNPQWVPWRDHATTLANLGQLHLLRKQYSHAEKALGEALAIRRKHLGENHPDYAGSLTSLGGLAFRRGDWAAAERYFLQALTVRRRSGTERNLGYAAALSNLALVFDRRGELAEARKLAREAVAVCRGHLEAVAAAQSEQQQLALLRTFRGLLDHYLSLAVRSGAPAEEVYAALLAWKGSVFARQQRQRERRLIGAAARGHAELEEATRQLADLARRPGADAKDVAAAAERREQLERQLAAAAPAVRQRRQAARLTPQALQAALPRDTALVDYLEFLHDLPPEKGQTQGGRQLRLLAVVVRPGRPLRLLDLGPAQEVTQAATRWRGTLRRRQPVQGDDDPAVRLRRLVWQPLVAELAGVTTVLVSPDGPLGRVPLAALPGKEKGKYLLEEVGIGVLPVPQALPALLAAGGPARPQEPALLVVGDVDFGDAAGATAPRSRGTGWARLPGTRGEMLAVRDSFEQKYPFPDGQTRALRGSRATEAAFRQQAPLHRWLHVATHGYFDPEGLPSGLAVAAQRSKGGELPAARTRSGYHPGLLSGLVFAGANRQANPGEDDGILTALEVAELDLGRMELAVLSACQTGLGEAAGGEGLLGLQRAFQVAGARTVVASLWSVEDEATRKLMERFYENLWQKGQPRLQALRQAQLWMLREGETRGFAPRPSKQEAGRTPPFYWAAFVLSGDWR